MLEPDFTGRSATRRPAPVGADLLKLDRLKLYVGDALMAELEPDRGDGHLPHPPFFTDLLQASWGQHLGDLRIEGYLGGELGSRRPDAGARRPMRNCSRAGRPGAPGRRHRRHTCRPSGHRRRGSPRPFATGADHARARRDPADIGENPFALAGGVGAVWVKTTEQPGEITLTATHPYLGSRTITLPRRRSHPSRSDRTNPHRSGHPLPAIHRASNQHEEQHHDDRRNTMNASCGSVSAANSSPPD